MKYRWLVAAAGASALLGSSLEAAESSVKKLRLVLVEGPMAEVMRISLAA